VGAREAAAGAAACGGRCGSSGAEAESATAAAARWRRRGECSRMWGVEAAYGGGRSRGGRGSVRVVTRGGGGGAGTAADGEGEGEREGEGQGPVGRLPSWAGPPVASFFIFLIFYFSHMMYKCIINY